MIYDAGRSQDGPGTESAPRATEGRGVFDGRDVHLRRPPARESRLPRSPHGRRRGRHTALHRVGTTAYRRQ